MSHKRIKTTYNEEGAYGSVVEKTVYAHHNLTCDYVTFYDDKGNHILTVPDTMDNNILDAINKLYSYNLDTTNTIEFMDENDRNTCKL